jgi:poly-beta-1,6-N-acetyl-D-glucosamine synthase
VLRLAFWLSSALAGWVLAGYPAVLALLPRRPLRRGEASGGVGAPFVSVIIPTYCEHERLPLKLETLRALDYPHDRLEVVVVSDGDPRLAEIAREVLPDAKVLLLEHRSGKPRALNTAIAAARGEILVLTDAHSPLTPSSVSALCAPLQDARVAAVSGRWAEEGSPYDAYEHVVRRLESRSGSTAGVFGGLLAVRRELLPPFPEWVVNDDLWLLCRVISSGGRVVYEPAAHAVEARLDDDAQIVRRSRISAGRMQLLGEIARLPPAFAWRLLSHKVGRLALPGLLLVAFGSSLTLARRRLYLLLALAQGGFYLLGVTGAALGRAGRPVPLIVRVARQFLIGNVAVLLGVVRALRRRQSVRWDPAR